MSGDPDKPIDPRERAEFLEEIGDVKPVGSGNRRPPARNRPSARPRMKEQDEADVLAELEIAEPDADTDTGDEHHFRQNGVQDSVMRKLRRGKYRVENEIDLHGLTRAGARELLVEFLLEARRENWRCVRIVHGKGLGSGHRGPVLKTWLDGWLRKRSEVLAYCTARPVDGGSGASYVLLRRS